MGRGTWSLCEMKVEKNEMQRGVPEIDRNLLVSGVQAECSAYLV